MSHLLLGSTSGPKVPNFYGPGNLHGAFLARPHKCDIPQGEIYAKPNTMAIFRTSDYNVYIRPPPSLDFQYDHTRPRDDFVISGVVMVNLTKPRRVLGLKVRFLCEAKLAFPTRPVLDEEILVERVLELGDSSEGMLLEAGLQRFDWSFVLPPTLAGFDRTTSGRIVHRVEATLTGQPATSRFSSFFSTGSSPRTSPSRMRSPSPMGSRSRPSSPGITTPTPPFSSERRPSNSRRPSSSSGSTSITPSFGESSSSSTPSLDNVKWLSGSMTASKDFWIIPLPTENYEPMSFRGDLRSLVEGLGIVPWSLETDQSTVGGAVSFQMSILDPAPTASIWVIRLYVSQTVRLKSPSRPDEAEITNPAVRLTLFDKGRLPKDVNHAHEPLWSGEEVPGTDGKGIESVGIQKVLRLPDENKMRPSTCPGTETPLRLSHEFMLHIFFSIVNEDGHGNRLPQPGPGHLRKAMLSQRTFFTSCCCTRQNLALPSFEQSQADIQTFDPETADLDACACGLRLDELAERELDRFRTDQEREAAFAELEEGVGEMTDGGGSGRGRRRKAEYYPSSTPPLTGGPTSPPLFAENGYGSGNGNGLGNGGYRQDYSPGPPGSGSPIMAPVRNLSPTIEPEGGASLMAEMGRTMSALHIGSPRTGSASLG